MIRRRRPIAAVFFGVTNIVVGALGLVFYCCSGLMVTILAAERSGALWAFLSDNLRILNPMVAAYIVASLLICLLLLISGLGLLNLHNWGRLVSIVCAVLAILLNVWNVIFQLAFVGPTAQRFVETAMHPGQRAESAAQATFLNIFVIGVALLAVLYSLALLITLLLPDVTSSFHQGPPPGWDDDLDDEDDRPRHRRPRDDDWDD
jgi:hypothetical protein